MTSTVAAEPISLGYFQFDNLVRNKIPFLLLTLKIDLEPYFGVLERLHLKNYTVLLEDFSLSEVNRVLLEKQANQHQPIVIICEDGKKSLRLAQALTEQNFLNVYFFSGGFLAFKNESTLA